MFKLLRRKQATAQTIQENTVSNDINKDLPNAIQSKTFRHYAEEYLFLQESKAHKTYLQGLWAVNNHLNPFFGDMPVASIRFVDVEKFIAIKKKSGLRVDHIMTRFRAVMKLAYGYGERLQEIKVSKQDPKPSIGHAYTRKELAKLMWNARPNRSLVLQCFCSYVMGFRHSEIVKMHWEFLTFKEVMVEKEVRRGVIETVPEIQGTCTLPPWFLKTPRTNNRIMRIDPRIVRILLARKRRAKPDEKFLFPSKLLPGQPQQSNCSAWKRLKKRCGMNQFRFHDLRHTAVSHMAANRAPAVFIGKYVGMSAKVVEDIYAHTNDDMAIAAMSRNPEKRKIKKLKIA